MLETDASSRRHLIVMAAFILLLFGGFALYGTVQRVVQTVGSGGIGDPAPVTEDRATLLAARRVWFKARQEMAKHGKLEEWKEAVAVADKYLQTTSDDSIRLLRCEALVRQGDQQASADIATLAQHDPSVSAGERSLLNGDTQAYQQEAAETVAKIDESHMTVLDANNAAWQAAISTPDTATLTKAIRLSEYAVAQTPKSLDLRTSRATYTNTLGALYVRAGRYDDALRLLSESEQLQPDVFNAPFFTLAYQGRGDYAKAQAWRTRLRKRLNDTFATRDGQQNRQELLLLWRETEQAVKETPSPAPNGTYYGI